MSFTNILTAAKAVLADVASLSQPGNKALVGVIAGGVVAIAASLFGVHLSTAEVTGWELLAAGGAATAEKLLTKAPAPVAPVAPVTPAKS